ncbi:hypothetical protein WJX74_002699 [Apatococcus lobatus]|uniref:Uncharacterized protein n=1 Tax=Apatococcus lobatus TaxID=904363 RepID=A0AAW1R315_9CHLO
MACSTWGVTNPRSGRWSDDGEGTLIYGPVPAFGGAVRSEVVQAASSTLLQSESAMRPTADSLQSQTQTQVALSQEQQAQQAREKLASDFRARRLRATALRHLRQEQLSTRALMHWGYPAQPGSPSESPSEPQPQPELPAVAPAPSRPCTSALASTSPSATHLPSGKLRRPDLALYAPAARRIAAMRAPPSRLPAAASSQPYARTSAASVSTSFVGLSRLYQLSSEESAALLHGAPSRLYAGRAAARTTVQGSVLRPARLQKASSAQSHPIPSHSCCWSRRRSVKQ